MSTKLTDIGDLDALPRGAIVRGYDGFRHEKWSDDRWLLIVRAASALHEAHEIERPATLLYGGEK